MVSFDALWKNYPTKENIKSQCTNKQKASNEPFNDYCAIMLSDCVIRSGVDISIIKGDRCWSHHGKKHILRAEDLANGLKKHRPPNFGILEKIQPAFFQSAVSNKTGVIFFKDYWQREKESFDRRSGDHIDLWNKNEITSSGMFIRSVLEFFGRVSDLNNCREIWFWEVK
ncbi:MAG: type VI secretion system amidase effector protein Tae4 [Gammaproteobacteria bacterium]|nr:type VI secretion system amidase effector protein Tae4 [Gammaproteobacteria bacterium]